MISRICGKLKEKKDDRVLIETHGIYYEVLIPACVMSNLEKSIGEDGEIILTTFHYHHQDPARSVPMLIGFINEIEKEFFEKFITVSGVGPRAAVRALALPIPQIARAIDEADMSMLKSLPGIGEQRAKEIVAKLQGKVGKFGLIKDEGPAKPSAGFEDIKEEALSVLLQLQYNRKEAQNMIEEAIKRNSSINTAEDILNEVYKQRK